MAVSFQKTIPLLRIFDVEKAKEFYVDCLGFSLDLFSAPLCLMVAYLMLDEVFVHGPTGRGFGSAVSEASRDLR